MGQMEELLPCVHTAFVIADVLWLCLIKLGDNVGGISPSYCARLRKRATTNSSSLQLPPAAHFITLLSVPCSAPWAALDD